jgi:hypothetical protein
MEENRGEGEDNPMHRRRITMADGKRYLIFYTFGEEDGAAAGEAGPKGEPAPQPEADEERHV